MTEEQRKRARVASRAYYQRNKEKERQRAIAWRAANPERFQVLQKRSYEKNADKIRDRQRRDADKNRERRNARLRAQYAANPEPFKRRSTVTDAKRLAAKKAREAQYRDENRKHVRAIDAASKKRNWAKVRVGYAAKAARRAKAEGSFTGDDIKALFAAQKGRCPICRDSIAKRFHIDHVMPLIRGGRNDRTNLQLLCVTCNLRKGPKDPIAFAQERGLLV
jgi:5-methylcytosine-specific restriction endonuclease McrA